MVNFIDFTCEEVEGLQKPKTTKRKESAQMNQSTWSCLGGCTWLPNLTTIPSMSRTYPTFCPHSLSSGSLTPTAPFSTARCKPPHHYQFPISNQQNHDNFSFLTNNINPRTPYLVGSLDIRKSETNFDRRSFPAGPRILHCPRDAVRLALVRRSECYGRLSALQLPPSTYTTYVRT